MHVCCAPCFSYIENDITNNGVNINGERKKVEMTAYWSNPNIHPKFEYERRKDTFVYFCNLKNINYIINDKYDMAEFVKDVVDKTMNTSLFKTRCEYCYYTRLKDAFIYAKDNGYNYVSTTLTISPYQNHQIITEVGKRLEKEYNIKFLYLDYRESYRKGQQLAKDLGLYRQKYCGCVLSMDSGKWVY